MRVPPVPIPNTEVKPHRAESTWRATAWQDRSSPGFFYANYARDSLGWKRGILFLRLSSVDANMRVYLIQYSYLNF